MIKVENLVKKYGEHTAVDHLTFEVEKGQIYGFLGPNGAGKSTTMNIITGYIAATSGEVTINGHDIFKEPEAAKKSIGYLPELPPLYFDMTVSEYLLFAAELKEIAKNKRQNQISEVMVMTQIDHVKDRLIKNLSKGYRQRVGLAQAILGNPEVIILDEPTVGLDPKQIIEIRDLIKKLSKEHTIILSSHILSEVSAICDTIMIIDHGKLVACDTTENLSALMIGSHILDLTVKGTESETRKVITGLGEISDFTVKETENSECVDVVIKTENKIDIRESVFYAFAEAKLPIIKMLFETKSLEDVFLELTDDEHPSKKTNGEIKEVEA